MDKAILVEISARHMHLTQEAFDFLMGLEEGQHGQLNVKKELSQPGQFASDSKFDLVGPVNEKTGKPRVIKGVSVLGPFRPENQVEISLTDARTLGVKAPVRLSGDIKGSAGISVVNPANGRELKLEEGTIAAKRHIHMTPADAEHYKVKDGDVVLVGVASEDRSLIFDDVVIRVSPKFSLAMHLDTDEANAAGISGNAKGYILNDECCCEDEDCGCGEGHCCCENK